MWLLIYHYALPSVHHAMKRWGHFGNIAAPYIIWLRRIAGNDATKSPPNPPIRPANAVTIPPIHLAAPPPRSPAPPSRTLQIHRFLHCRFAIPLRSPATYKRGLDGEGDERVEEEGQETSEGATAGRAC
jgi:hypothetical protein